MTLVGEGGLDVSYDSGTSDWGTLRARAANIRDNARIRITRPTLVNIPIAGGEVVVLNYIHGDVGGGEGIVVRRRLEQKLGEKIIPETILVIKIDGGIAQDPSNKGGFKFLDPSCEVIQRYNIQNNPDEFRQYDSVLGVFGK